MGSVQFVTNAGSLAAKKKVLAGKTEERFRQAARTQAEKMKFVAESLSAGPLTTIALRQMGHPYSTRRGPNSAPLPDFVINSQSGELRASWVCRAQKTRIGWTIGLYNSSKHAKYMMGTDRMRFRPILEEVVRRTSLGLPLEVKKIIRKAAQESGGTAPVSGTAGSVWGGLAYAVAAGASTVAGGIENAL